MTSLSTSGTTLSVNITGTPECSTSPGLCGICLNIPDGRESDIYTKQIRNMRNIGKTHADDAYCIGKFHPKHRCQTVCFQKRRRNNRILSKFYDAKYIDSRDGSTKSGSQLPNGRFSIRKQHYHIQPGDIVLYQGKKHICNGCHCNGTRAILMSDKKSVVIKDVIKKIAGGWKPIAI